MGQPTPPGDIPLIEGLDPGWNEIVGLIPEDKRAEIAPRFKERLSEYEPLKQWEDFHKSGITPDQVSTALNIYSVIENNPREVYETIGKHLNITPQQAKEVVEEIKESDSDDPRIVKLQQQIDTMSQIMLAQREQTTQQQRAAEQDAAIEKEIKDVQKKYGNDVPEDEILMRMYAKGLSAEQAYQEYAERVSQIRSTRPSPMVMGSGGAVPSRQIDVRKLDSAQTKNLVAQMLEHGNNERNS